MKKVQILLLLVLIINFCGCSSFNTVRLNEYSFEGDYVYTNNSGTQLAAVIDGKTLELIIGVGGEFHKELSSYFTIVKENNGRFYLYQNEKAEGEIEYIDDGIVKIDFFGSNTMDGMYYSDDSLNTRIV
ncbi:MAG: hypothetical protein J5964_03900 [Eubacterium sp.]|nr:hypothetical protein [Eubacterium sp.]